MKTKLKIGVIWVAFCAIALYLAGTWAVTKYAFDTDLLWHIKIGDDILKRGEIFLENDYSWLEGTIWTQQEWLFSIILYGTISLFGIVGFYALHLIPQATLLGLSLKKNKYHFMLLAPALFLLMYWYLPFNHVNRPAEFSTYFFVIMIFLYDKKFKLKPLVYFVCGVFLANFHCGAAVALLVLMGMMFGLDIVLNFLFLRMNKEPWTMTWKFALQYAISCVLFVVGLCINPYGFNQVKNMFCVMNLNSTQYINEWKPFCSNEYIVWIMLFAIAYSFGYGLHKHKWDKNETIKIVVMSAFLVLSLTSLKGFIMFFYIYIMYGFKYIDEMLYDACQRMNLKKELKIKKLHVSWPETLPGKRVIYSGMIVVSTIFAIIVASYNQGSMDKLINSVRNDYATEGAVAYLKQASVQEDEFRLLNGYVTGNYLLYYNVPCFIDARQQPYSKEFGWSEAVDDYFDTNSMNTSEMDDFFEKYQFTHVLSNNEYGVNWYLQQRGDKWSMVYSDDEGNYIWKYMGTY